MKNLKHLDKYRVPFMGDYGDEFNGAFEIRLKDFGMEFHIIASNGLGWDHVSISTETRCPKWNEMQQFKEMFFKDDEVVMQLHPAKENYINHYEFCLHLWRPQEVEIPLPPTIMV